MFLFALFLFGDAAIATVAAEAEVAEEEEGAGVTTAEVEAVPVGRGAAVPTGTRDAI